MVTDHSVDRNADFGCFFVTRTLEGINFVEMLDVRSSTPALSTQFITKNHLKLDVLLNQTTRPDLLLFMRVSVADWDNFEYAFNETTF